MLRLHKFYSPNASGENVASGDEMYAELTSMAQEQMGEWAGKEPMDGEPENDLYLSGNDPETPLPGDLVKPSETTETPPAPPAPPAQVSEKKDGEEVEGSDTKKSSDNDVEPKPQPSDSEFYDFQGRKFSKSDVEDVFKGFSDYHSRFEDFAKSQAEFEQTKAEFEKTREEFESSADNSILKFLRDNPDQRDAVLEHIQETNPEIIDEHGRAGQSNAVKGLGSELESLKAELAAMKADQEYRVNEARARQEQAYFNNLKNEIDNYIGEYSAGAVKDIASGSGVDSKAILSDSDLMAMRYKADAAMRSGSLRPDKESLEGFFKSEIDSHVNRVKSLIGIEQSRHLSSKAKIPPAPPSVGGAPNPIAGPDLSDWRKIDAEANRQYDAIFNKINNR